MLEGGSKCRNTLYSVYRAQFKLFIALRDTILCELYTVHKRCVVYVSWETLNSVLVVVNITFYQLQCKGSALDLTVSRSRSDSGILNTESRSNSILENSQNTKFNTVPVYCKGQNTLHVLHCYRINLSKWKCKTPTKWKSNVDKKMRNPFGDILFCCLFNLKYPFC